MATTNSQLTAKIKELQTTLGVKADGIIGPKTRAAAKARGVALPTAAKVAPANLVAAKLTKPVVAVAAPIPAAFMAPKATIRAPDLSAMVSAIPPQARAAAASSLQQLASTPGVTMSDLDRLVAALTATMAPQLTAITEVLKQKQVSAQATGESNAIIQDSERWDGIGSQFAANAKNWELNAERWAGNAAVQADILRQIGDMAKRITAKDAATKRLYQAYGIPL